MHGTQSVKQEPTYGEVFGEQDHYAKVSTPQLTEPFRVSTIRAYGHDQYDEGAKNDGVSSPQ